MGRLFLVTLSLAVGSFLEQTSYADVTSFTPWHLDRLDQRTGLDFSPYQGHVTARARPALYVVDSGVDREHMEFTSGRSAVVDGYNFVDESWDTSDCLGHGTHVAALAAGREYGVAGSIGVDIVAIRILDCQGRGKCSSMIRALEWVRQNHSEMRAGVPGVVVMSIGSRQAECEAAHIVADSLSDKNIIVVAAAGNSGADACMFHPASSKNAITVGAVGLEDSHDVAWSKTNFGDCVNIFAPGVAIKSAWPGSEFGNGTKVLSGTSMAAPLVAGQALLIVAAVPEATVAVTRKIIEASASRGTLFGNQVNPTARGSRVARVPWLNVDHRNSISFSTDGGYSSESLFALDNIILWLRASSSTAPAMQYAVEHIAYSIFECAKENPSFGKQSELHVSCSSGEKDGIASMGKYETTRRRGWDVRQKSVDAGVIPMCIFCNISVSAGLGRDIRASIVQLCTVGGLKDMFGRNITLLLDPLLTTARQDSAGNTSLQVVAITVPTVAVFVALGVLLLWLRRRRHMSLMSGT